MDWERKSLDWTDRDLDTFRYGLRETTVVTKLAINEANSKVGGLLELTSTSLTHDRRSLWTILAREVTGMYGLRGKVLLLLLFNKVTNQSRLPSSDPARESLDYVSCRKE